MASEYQLGIDDGKVAAIDNTGTVSTTKVDILGITSFGMSIESDSVEHRGDNQSLRIRKTGKRATGSIEQAATQLALYPVVSDGVTTTTGTAADMVTTYTEPSTSPGKQYQVEVQAADIDGATRFTVLAASTTGGPNFELSEGEFANPGWDYEANAKSGNLFMIEQYATEEPIA